MSSNACPLTSLGQAWTHTFAVHLAHPRDGSPDILLVDPQGRTAEFVYDAQGTCSAVLD